MVQRDYNIKAQTVSLIKAGGKELSMLFTDRHFDKIGIIFF